jgi:putative nucleotidyltransferase with HDIG domain
MSCLVAPANELPVAERLLDLLDDRGMAGHALAVAALATAVCDALDVDVFETARIQRAALLHDVGKLAVHAEVLESPGPLSSREWKLVRSHPEVGERLMLAFPRLAGLAPLVRHHHEHWDGSGYPDGLAGPEIPLGARIIAACDAFDAMVSARPYRMAMDADAALREIERAAGTHLEPDVACAFVQVAGTIGLA